MVAVAMAGLLIVVRAAVVTVILTQGATQPDQYVRAIRDRLAVHR